MKISLKEILESKSNIVSIGKRMGLCGLQFVKTNCDNAFHLRASLESTDPYAIATHATICENYLSIQLGCKVLIDVLTESYKQRLAKRPRVSSRGRRRDQECVVALAELDEDKVREIYSCSSDQIHFYADDIPEDEKALEEHDRAQVLSIANDIMKKWDERQTLDVRQSEHVVVTLPNPDVDAQRVDEVDKREVQQAFRQLLASFGVKRQSSSISMWEQPTLSKNGILKIIEFCWEVAEKEYEQPDRLFDDFLKQKRRRTEESQTPKR